MEAATAAGGTPESNWSTYSSTTVPAEDSEIMALLFGSAAYPEDPAGDESLEMDASMYWHDHEMVAPSYYTNSTDDANAGFAYSWSQGCGGGNSSNRGDVKESYYLSDPSAAEPSNASSIFMAEEKSNASSILPGPENNYLEESSCLEAANEPEEQPAASSPPHRKPTPKRGLTTAIPERKRSSSSSSSSKITTTKKKSRVSTTPDDDVSGKSSKRVQRSITNPSDSEDCNDSTTVSRQNSECLSSEDDSSSARDINDEEENSGKKTGGSSSRTRACGGSATDPQSLYARKRRERINERLKILQNLVPNGTKACSNRVLPWPRYPSVGLWSVKCGLVAALQVDISTMLEEAVQYVNFLQLQIKVLSSNDRWMFAPIAYNGMDIGLNLKISPPQ